MYKFMELTGALGSPYGMAFKYFRYYNPVLGYHNKNPCALVSLSLEPPKCEMELVLSPGLTEEMYFHTEFARGVFCNQV